MISNKYVNFEVMVDTLGCAASYVMSFNMALGNKHFWFKLIGGQAP